MELTSRLQVVNTQLNQDAVKAAHDAGKELLVDMSGVRDVATRARE